MAVVGQCATDPVSGIAGDIWNEWTASGGGGASGLVAEALVSGNAYRALVAERIRAEATAILAGGGGTSPLYFKLDPTSTAQFGTGRVSTGPSVPTVSTGTDAAGRPYLRFTANSSNASFMPLLVGGAELALEGEFLIELRANWVAGQGGGQMRGVGFNGDPAGTGCFAVTNNSADGTRWDSVINGANENQTIGDLANVDASYEFPHLWVRVWLSTATARCTYTYSYARDIADFKQRRKTTLAVAGGTSVGLYSVANTGTFDVYAFNVWKPGRLW